MSNSWQNIIETTVELSPDTQFEDVNNLIDMTQIQIKSKTATKEKYKPTQYNNHAIPDFMEKQALNPQFTMYQKNWKGSDS